MRYNIYYFIIIENFNRNLKKIELLVFFKSQAQTFYVLNF